MQPTEPEYHPDARGERLARATKRTYRRARAEGRPITFKRARELARLFLGRMWRETKNGTTA